MIQMTQYYFVLLIRRMKMRVITYSMLVVYINWLLNKVTSTVNIIDIITTVQLHKQSFCQICLTPTGGQFPANFTSCWGKA